MPLIAKALTGVDRLTEHFDKTSKKTRLFIEQIKRKMARQSRAKIAQKRDEIKSGINT